MNLILGVTKQNVRERCTYKHVVRGAVLAAAVAVAAVGVGLRWLLLLLPPS